MRYNSVLQTRVLGDAMNIPSAAIRSESELQNNSIPTLTREQIDRFWNQVLVPDQISCCWEWSGAKNQWGYGHKRFGLQNFKAHRVAYMLLIGEIPDGMTLDHLCRNTSCVNPDHLQLTDSKENKLRGFSLPSLNARKTHCDYGHVYDDKNTLITVRGGRCCRACNRRRSKASSDRKAGR